MDIRFLFLIFCVIFYSGFSHSQIYCIDKAGAKLHSKPFEKSTPAWRAPRYTPLMGTGAKSGMLVEVVDMDSKKYWVNKKSLSGRISCLTIRVKKTSLRMGPGLTFKPASSKFASRYESFLDLGGEDGWTQVQDISGNKAWVNLDQVWKPKYRMRISFEN